MGGREIGEGRSEAWPARGANRAPRCCALAAAPATRTATPESDPALRGAPRRPHPEEESDQRREDEGHADGHRRDQRGRADASHEHRHPDAEADAEQAAGEAEHQRLDQELAHDRELGGAERLADADLLGALRDRDQHDVHDADAADERARRRRSSSRSLRRSRRSAAESRGTPSASESGSCWRAPGRILCSRRMIRSTSTIPCSIGSFRVDDHRDGAETIGAEDAIARGAERDENLLVGVHEPLGALGAQHPDDLEGNAAHREALPDDCGAIGIEHLRHVGTDHGVALARRVITVSEHPTGGNGVIASPDIVRRRPDDAGVDVLVRRRSPADFAPSPARWP